MSKVKLQVRVKVKAGDRKYPFVSPAFAPNGKIKPGVAIIGKAITGKNEVPVVQTFGYYLRYTENGKRHLRYVGIDAAKALDSMRRTEAALKAKSLGIAVVEEPKQALTERIRLGDAAAEYLAEVQGHTADRHSDIRKDHSDFKSLPSESGRLPPQIDR